MTTKDRNSEKIDSVFLLSLLRENCLCQEHLILIQQNPSWYEIQTVHSWVVELSTPQLKEQIYCPFPVLQGETDLCEQIKVIPL